jgi:hypothetical protein
MEIIDPDLGKVLGAIGHGLNRVAHIGGRYAVRGARAGSKCGFKGLRSPGNGLHNNWQKDTIHPC